MELAPGLTGLKTKAGSFPPLQLSGRSILLERILACLFLAAIAVLGQLEGSSGLAAAIRKGKPLDFWLVLKTPAEEPRLFMGLLNPGRRTLDLVYIHEAQGPRENSSLWPAYRQGLRMSNDPLVLSKGMAESARARLSSEIPAAREAQPLRLLYEEIPPWPGGEPPLMGKAWIERWAQGLSFQTGILRIILESPSDFSTLTLFDRMLLALEIHHLPQGAIHPAWLPEAKLQRSYLGLLMGNHPQTADNSRPISVEVLNASGRQGFAAQATKILRWKGADVVNIGNLAAIQSMTLIYDRTGFFKNAAAAAEMLGCPEAGVLTQLRPQRLVDVSIILAEDCHLRP
jgi:hypothetical protein